MADVDEQKGEKYREYKQSRVSKHNRKRFGPSLLLVDTSRFASLVDRLNDDTVVSFNFLIREDNGFRARALEIQPRNRELQTLPANLEGFRRKRPGTAYTAPYLQAMAYLIAHNCEQVAGSKPKVNWGEVEYQLKRRGFDVACEEALASKAESMAFNVYMKRPQFMAVEDFNQLRDIYKHLFRFSSLFCIDPARVQAFSRVRNDVGEAALLGGNR